MTETKLSVAAGRLSHWQTGNLFISTDETFSLTKANLSIEREGAALTRPTVRTGLYKRAFFHIDTPGFSMLHCVKLLKKSE